MERNSTLDHFVTGLLIGGVMEVGANRIDVILRMDVPAIYCAYVGIAGALAIASLKKSREIVVKQAINAAGMVSAATGVYLLLEKYFQ